MIEEGNKKKEENDKNPTGQQKPSCLSRFYECICCASKPKFPSPYTFKFSAPNSPIPENQQSFQSNFVRTSKYTKLSFFPKALILQFKRLANVYFLIIAILQTIPVISPLDPITAWMPLILVLAISIIREGYEDYQRMKSDKQINFGVYTKVFRDGKFIQATWSDVLVGDIVQVSQQGFFPADLILLASSLDNGAAFIETASLDGEKNLKPRSSFKATTQFNSPEALKNFSGQYFQNNPPDEDLHKYSARMMVNGQTEPLLIKNDKQFLYRGTRLKNTKWIYGLVIQTGRNTKIVMNSKEGADKMSQIQIKVNRILLIIFLTQLVLCFITALLYGIFRNQNQSTLTYINWPTFNVALDSFLVALSYLVLLNTMIPISLIVSIQIVKMAQKIFIEQDKLMFSELRSKGVAVKSASLNQELGQIEYVFSDKTGTLTMNIMEFKIAVIASKMYGDLSVISDHTRQSVGYAGGPGRSLEKKIPTNKKGFYDDQLKALIETGRSQQNLNKEIIVKDKEGNNQIKLSTNRQIAKQYMKALALAHEVISDVNQSGDKVYQGPSPDQITLVDAAREMGYQFMKATQEETNLQILGDKKRFTVKEVFSFNSDRKRMSIIVEDQGVLKMYTKGADSIVKQRLSHDNKLNLDLELTKFSSIGLRTLLIAMRTISKQQYQKYRQNIAKLSTEKISQKEKEKKNDQYISELQTNLYLIGATAVLDRLQDDVPQTIRDLIRANIKVWMLTGDKMQTAENIAKSCNLIQESFEVLRYQLEADERMTENSTARRPKKPVEASDQAFILDEKVTDKDREMHRIVMRKLTEMTKEADRLFAEGTPKGLLIQGSDLTNILKYEASRKQLALLSKDCEAVVCCRLLPSQKAEVVKVVRQHLNKITLSIGDGANDVPMIKQAHIGVGLFGQEGMNAVQSSDYALPEFRMLWRLLLVHGRWNYIRISEMILYFFYKNMLFTLPQFLIAFFNGYSGQTIFDDWYVTLYNVAFTSIPLILRAVFEQDVNYIYKSETRKNKKKGQVYEPSPNIQSIKSLIVQERYLPHEYKTNKYFYRLFPKIYFIGQENCIFNYQNYFAWIIQAIIESIAICYFTLFVLSQISINQTGINSDYWIVSLTIFSSVIFVVTFKLATHTRFWTIYLLISIIITSFGFYVLHMWLTNFTMSDNVQGTTLVAWSSIETYFLVLFCGCMVLFVDGIVVFIDFRRGGYTSRMRKVVHEEKINSRRIYSEMSLSITEGLTEAQGRK